MHLGLLLPEHFLREGIRSTEAYRAFADVASLRQRLTDILARFPTDSSPNESQTEQDLIFPVLDTLGWGQDCRLTQQRAARRGRADVPDLLLFDGPEAKARANAERDEADRFRHGLVVAESKRWNRALDRADAGGADGREVPSSQMLRYLSRAETLSDRRIQWGILTNGGRWRLYWQPAKSRSEEYLEIDLAGVLGTVPDLLAPPESERDHWLTVFALLFGRTAFTVEVEAGRTFALVALDRGRLFEEELTDRLDHVVFGTVFEGLAGALDAANPQARHPRTVAYLDEIKQATLTLLYRLLFVLYAEDRDLLPTRDRRYVDYGLGPLRDEIAERIERNEPLSGRVGRYWGRLRGLFRAIGEGEPSLGLPPYNGGLFAPDLAPLLERVELGDAALAPILLALSHREVEGRQRRINYRDLSVQQLGSIYERLLENELEERPDGSLGVRKDQERRKRSGSFYTPEELVRLILTRTLQPLLDAITETFEARAEALAGDRRPRSERLAELVKLDPASRFLELKVCDPAMGSGHFLVSAVDYLADRVLEAMAAARTTAELAIRDAAYESPLAGRVAAIRDRILQLARSGGWAVDATQLDDRRLVRRMILKRVIHGVDKNPMAVELAKVALWLHTFTVGAPLSFLDHHLRCGDSLLGGWAADLRQWLGRRGGLLTGSIIAGVERASAGMGEVEALTDSDIAEVAHSRDTFATVAETTAPLAALMSMIQAERLMGVLAAAPQRKPKSLDDLRRAGASQQTIERALPAIEAWERAKAWQDVLDGTFGDPVRVATGEIEIATPELREQLALLPDAPPAQPALFDGGPPDARRRILAHGLVDQARAIATEHRFLHWQLAFPNVWQDWLSQSPRGGFDAVIGNPPYVRQEKLAAIKPALKQAYTAWDGMADLYVYFYELGLKLLRPGGRLSYVVTNKWLKAGYAEELRGLLSEKSWLELVVDFGHAKQFFKDADVFPCVIVAERPDHRAAPEQTRTCLIPREDVRPADLVKQVEELSFPLPRLSFARQSWVLEPPDVQALLDKIRRNGVPLAEYAGVKPLYGIKTGFNKAFLIDTPTRDRLVAEDPGCAEIIKPYLRGQDIDRWYAPWAGLWMIFARRGIEIERYPSVLRHLQRYREQLEPKPEGWRPSRPGEQWAGRKPGNYAWYEIQDTIDYWPLFDRPKIIYQDIMWTPDFAMSHDRVVLNNTSYFIPANDPWLLATLNSTANWWFVWRLAEPGKDEARRYFNTLIEPLPIPRPVDAMIEKSGPLVGHLTRIAHDCAERRALLDGWYRAEHGIEKPGARLADPLALSAEAFSAEIRKARGARRSLSAAAVQAIREEWERTIRPARALLAESERLERELSDLVNEAYGLTREEVRLMWDTAPPRMPPGRPAWLE